jgi:hypothetical protein
MLLNFNQVGQIRLPVIDTDRSEALYEKVLGLRSFTVSATSHSSIAPQGASCSDKVKEPAKFLPQGSIYFRCSDIALTVASSRSAG